MIAKLSGVLPGLTYVWDKAFDLRMQQAHMEGSRRCFGADAGGGRSWVRSQEFVQGGRGGRCGASASSSSGSPRCPTCSRRPRQRFGRCLGPLIRDVASERDWARLAALWHPDSDAYLFRRPGGHFVRSLTFLSGQLPA
ncbi:MAG: hypothetical protein ACRD0K_18885 [Egibacteraceae bacterium]